MNDVYYSASINRFIDAKQLIGFTPVEKKQIKTNFTEESKKRYKQ